MKSVVSLFTLALIVFTPSAAFAEWKLKVLDLRTREERTFLLPPDREFDLPVVMAGWKCVSHQVDKAFKDIQCFNGEGWASLLAVKGDAGWQHLYIGAGKGSWKLSLKWE